MRTLGLLLTIGLASCGSDNEPAPEASAQISAETTTTALDAEPKVLAAPSAPLSADDRARVCRAAIADMNGHSPDIVKVLSNSDDSVVVKYNRPDDGKAWTNECRFEGDRVVWRTIGAFGGSEPGRWRDTSADETVKFAIDGQQITITTTYSDGSGGSETYSVN